MHSKFFIVFVYWSFLTSLVSCGNLSENATEIKSVELMPVDSFWMDRLHSSQEEIMTLYPFDDTNIIGFDHFNQLNFYTKNKNVFLYKKSKVLIPERSFSAFLSMNKSKNKYYVLAEKTIYTYDSLYNLKDSSKFNHTMRHLKNDYFPASANLLPLINFGDTLVSYYSHSSATDFYKTYREPAFMEFTPSKSIDSVTTYLEKPRDLQFYEVGFLTFHTAINNKLYKLYNGIDTLYEYNRLTHKEGKMPIHNKDYVLPERSNSKNLFDFGYLTKRSLSNFAYTGMFYNPMTGNTILFYNTPVSASGDKNPTSKNQKLKAIILDNELKAINYLDFKEEFFPTTTFFLYTNKGLAMPLDNDDPSNQKTKFYIYNF
jgi:hypothetical protein